MFVRRKPNKSGLVSIQVIEKRSGRYKVVKTVGSSMDENVIIKLVRQGEEFIKSKRGLQGISVVVPTPGYLTASKPSRSIACIGVLLAY